PALLRAAVGEALRRRVDLLSLEPRQELVTLWERLVIPAGLFVLAFLRDFRSLNDPASPQAAANGQFILIRRAVYDRIGGHAAVRDAICEDRALAQAAKDAGCSVALLGAATLARTRMYRNLPALWEGLRKNSTETLRRAAELGQPVRAAGGGAALGRRAGKRAGFCRAAPCPLRLAGAVLPACRRRPLSRRAAPLRPAVSARLRPRRGHRLRRAAPALARLDGMEGAPLPDPRRELTRSPRWRRSVVSRRTNGRSPWPSRSPWRFSTSSASPSCRF